MPKDFTVTITNPRRAAEWQAVLGTTTVYIRSPIPKAASLPGHSDTLIYELDLDLLTDEQRADLIAHTAEKFNIPPEEVAAGLEEHGMPILAKDCSVTVRNPHRWF